MSSSQPPWLEVDLVVVGSGASGLAAAVTAAAEGCRVAVFEKDAQLGGTSAWSGGWMWLPGGLPKSEGNSAKVEPSPETYIRNELGPAAFARQEPKIRKFLSKTGEAVRYFRELKVAPLRFEADTLTPDFHMSEGWTKGRMLRTPAFKGRQLGDAIERLRRPLPEFTFLGMGIESGRELNHFLNALRSPVSAAYVASRLFGYLLDYIRYGRSMRLVNGHALVASLFNAALSAEGVAAAGHPYVDPLEDADPGKPPRFERIRLFESHPVQHLLCKAGSVHGVVVQTPHGLREVHARKGVVLSAGGFPHEIERLRKFVAHAPTGLEHFSAAPLANTGDGLRLGEAAGGRVEPTLAAPAAWAPVSRMPRTDGSIATYPHFVDRAKPGVIAVNQAGLRFCDEAGSYHDVVAAWIAASPRTGPLHAWLICDRCFLWRYGLGAVKPFTPWPLRALRTGYLTMGWTLAELARRCGIESKGLCTTVADFNKHSPKDPAFGRGSTAYDESQGDPVFDDYPCMAPILKPPFFAVRLYPGSLGTLAGLETDTDCLVLDDRDKPIEGLYACGNDMAGIMGGYYPSNGVTLGSALVFGHIAGLHAARRP